MPLPQEMIEMTLRGYGGPEVLRPQTVPVPIPQRGEILVRVEAAGVNRPDVLQRMGKYPLPPDAIPTPGLEVAGEVAAVGEEVSSFAVGDRVCGLTNGGGYAEYCRLPAGQALPWPRGLDAVRAAAIPETYFTVWANLFQMGRARAGETILIHGGTSGIGTTALGMAKAFGLVALATAGSADKCDVLRQLGADMAINYREEDFVVVVRQQTLGRGVDAILDIVGAAYLDRNIACLAQDGRLLLLAFLGGAVAERFDLRPVLAKRLVITGSAMRPRSTQEKAAIAAELHAQVWPLLESGKLAPVVYATYPLLQAAQAHRMMESSQHIGKLVLLVS